ncbi:NAD(P)H-binding protein [Nonomuraea insulae]|uniref:NAD(P)H-binding protein n=1 Tax=Nonomuraea insulae TaxID=1616787 RepID=A0ABW1CZ37_9ACTN
MTLASAIEGADAVLFALGSRKKTEPVSPRRARTIAEAMRATGVRRLVVVSGVGVTTIPTPGRPNPPRREPGAGFEMRYLTTPFAKIVIGAQMADAALMEDFLRGTDLDRTVMRVPLVVDKQSIIDLRPVYHRLEERIRAHVILC